MSSEIHSQPHDDTSPPAAPDSVLARSNGHAQGAGSPQGIDLNDARSRVVLEQLLTILAQDSAPVEDKPTKGASLYGYLAILRRRWLPMLLITLVVFPLVAWRLRPGETRYVATATILPPKSVLNPRGAADSMTALGTSSAGSSISNASLETQIAILTSPQLVARAMQKMTPLQRERGWGDPNAQAAVVNASTPVSSDMIDLTVTAKDPEAAAALTNTLIEVYTQRTQELADASNQVAFRLLSKQMKQAQDLLVKAKSELQDYREKTGVFDLDSKMKATAERLNELEQKVGATGNEVAQDQASGVLPASDEGLTALRQQVSEAKLNYEKVLRDFLPTAPETRKAEQALRGAQRLLAERIADQRETAQRLAQTRARALQAELSRTRQIAAALPSMEFKFSQLTQTVELLESTYRTIVDRYTSWTLNRHVQLSNVTVLTPATGGVAITESWRRAIIMGLLCAFSLAVLLATILEHLDDRIRSAEDLELMKAAVIGTIPHVDSLHERRLPYITGRHHEEKGLLEACRVLRSNLTFAALDQPLGIILVTSSVAAEGKSLSALNLATAMAYDGKRVILLDCDLRRPSQHRLNEIPLVPGFSNVLMGITTLDEALHATPVENLQVLSAGALPPNPPELLGSRACRHVIQELKERCDVLIVDTAPLVSISDTQILASVADGVLLVVAADSTTRQQLHRAQAMLRHSGCRLLGVIFNKVRPHNDPYGYYGYYNYYSYTQSATQDDGEKGLKKISSLQKPREPQS